MLPQVTMICPACGSEDTLRVVLTVVKSAASFTMCVACTWNTWDRLPTRAAASVAAGTER